MNCASPYQFQWKLGMLNTWWRFSPYLYQLISTLKSISIPTNRLTNLSSKLTFTVNITLAPVFNFSSVAKFPVSLNFLFLIPSNWLSLNCQPFGTSSISLRYTKDGSITSIDHSFIMTTDWIILPKNMYSSLWIVWCPLCNKSKQQGFIYLFIKILSQILFNNSTRLSSPYCLTTSVNSTILNLIRKSRLRILLIDELALYRGLPLTGAK